MEQKKVKFSLRYKLLLILTSLPLMSLFLYLLMATQLFEKDKIAYVFDSSVVVARSLTTQVRIEVESLIGSVKPVVENYDNLQGKFSVVSEDIFNKNRHLEALVLYRRSGSSYTKLGDLSKPNDLAKRFLQNENFLLDYRQKTTNQGLVLDMYTPTEEHLVFSYRFGKQSDPNHTILVILYQASSLIETFRKADLYTSYLVTSEFKLALGPTFDENSLISDQELSGLFSKIKTTNLPEGTGEVVTAANEPVLISYSDTGIQNMFVASAVSKVAALKAVDVLVAKSILFFIALLASTVIISVFASVRLTSTLRELYAATLLIAKGDFNVEVKSRSSDEVGGLAESFTWMAGEVSRLLSETAEKARMENELETVKMVQETLFPKLKCEFGSVDVIGHFEPASECGGDWFTYSKIGDFVYLWIGDATGHGAPAALITSAAKSASSIIEQIPGVTPGVALKTMNQAIHATAKGKVLMTFFLAAIDTRNGKMVYANASHDPPYLVRRKTGEKIKKKDLIPLMDVNGTRLGDQPNAIYKEAELDLGPGDVIFFYTDGVVDLEDSEGNAWGERKFLKVLTDSASNEGPLEGKMEYIKGKIEGYRSEHLVDDITMFVVEYKGAA